MGPDLSDGPCDTHSVSVNAPFPFSHREHLYQGWWRGKLFVLRGCEPKIGIKCFFFWMFWRSQGRERSWPPAAASWNCSAVQLVRKGWRLCSTFFFVIRLSLKTYNKWCCQETFFCSASGHCCSVQENRAPCYRSRGIADFSVWQQNWKIKWKKGFAWIILEYYFSC